ncbi:hypothetical protein HBI56_002830 [Parastagonospora nodorum]|uniref:Uncharacterized protein n=1 Tax=Phaeosphaeria nodorum (strain SN15 / ATCC MYA-4574 / FGSC 10173) TaxID=321614 RepID=A0A7U2ERL8_PHANO|nr:hypothetical protein HBH56_138210 [Parastagonospora nodorum]QRC91387.1 hypothetical protein JI435_401290 [Parastagonospora nodorum SN15]KAH3928208.1 hypothetical protein HBH54_143350 [Parastagonospora nodorum]KAH3949014.1 hypothetical protein HBH53_093350 [Parastagonospora nodorum]KAH3972498.1 hypothetical protein HBH52_151870 [Parastagonospora nodorum]
MLSSVSRSLPFRVVTLRPQCPEPTYLSDATKTQPDFTVRKKLRIPDLVRL